MKAKSVAAGADALVIGADQMLELDDGTMLSKPGSREEALAQLRALSGGTHYLHSAAVIAEKGERVWGETESVAMDVRELGEDFLAGLSRRANMRRSASMSAATGSRAWARNCSRRSRAAISPILGLPLLPLLAYLRERGLLRKLMGIPYAEVIGDPIAHSKSPLIHKFWLEKLGIEGDYRAVRVTADELAAYFERGAPIPTGAAATSPCR